MSTTISRATPAENAAIAETGWGSPSVVETYKKAEAITRPYADAMLSKAGLPSTLTTPLNIIDLACGTGVQAAALYAKYPASSWDKITVLNGDVSEAMISAVNERAAISGWAGSTGRVMDGTKDMQLPATSFTHAFICFGAFLMPLSTLSQLRASLVPGGFIALSCWKSFAWYPFVAEAVTRLPARTSSGQKLRVPTEADIQRKIHLSGDWQDPSFTETALTGAGFEGVQVEVVRHTGSVGTPAELAATLKMPILLTCMMWTELSEKEREALIKELEECVTAVLVEHAGGKEKTMQLEFEGIVGVGWKGKGV